MQDICFKEKTEHGDVSFPFAFYHVTKKHPRYQMEPHWHEECEICRVLSGDLEVNIDGQIYQGHGRNGEGDIFFINSGSLHSAVAKNCVYECIVFDMHFLLRERSSSNSFLYSLLYNQRQFVPFIKAPNLESLRQNDKILTKIPFDDEDDENTSYKPEPIVINDEMQEQVCRVINNLFTVLNEQNAGYQLKSFGLMYYLIGLFEDHDLFLQPDTPREAVNRIMKMRLALSYIHRNYKQDINLTNLSSLLELKPPSVVKLFRDIINRRPMDYVNSYRIHCAMEMLKTNSSSSVTAVAFDCGFSDVSYFSKVFKKYAGKTPREYLKALKKEIVL